MRDLPVVLLLATVCAGATAVHGVVTHGQMRKRMDGLVEDLGEGVVETTAASLRSTFAVLAELEAELATSLKAKGSAIAGQSPLPRDIEGFAVAAGLRHLLILDDDGALLAAARDFPAPEGEGADRADLALLAAAREIAAEARAGTVVKEWTAPEMGLKRALALAAPLPGGGTAVLVQDGEAFARVRAAAGADALARRLEEETRIAYVRFDAPEPPPDERTAAFDREIDGRGVLRVGIDRTPALDALAIQQRAAWLHGALLVAVVTLGSWGVLRLRRARAALKERLRRDERLMGLGKLAAGIAHEVRNPLNGIGLAVQRIRREPGVPPEVDRLAGVVLEESARLNRTVENVLRYARPAPPRLGRVDAMELFAAVAALARPEAEAKGVRIDLRAPEGLSVTCDADLLKGALWNLVRNAVESSPAGAPVTVTAAAKGRAIHIEVADQGPGIPADRRALVFEPFRSDRPQGLGLGLPLALAAAQAHGGTIEVDEPGGRFRIVLPVSEV
jgi:signal transduction histidine kinase